ncbi:MAG: hypothetical protein JXA81_00460 [Sedimentisphaerales bacterium]|nr:hypothetical protein [Sedimentisphaerales bacterium]
MKKYAIPAVILLVVLALVMVSFGQAQDRQAMRERFQNMSEEERAAFRERMRERGFGGRMSREDQEKAVKEIEQQVAKLKAAIQAERPQGGFQDLSEEERNKLRQSFTDRRNALQAIIAQVAALEGRRQPEAAEDARFIIINTADLKPIQEMAEKEKATETSQLLARMASRGSGRDFGGRRPGQRSSRQ